MCLAFFNPKPLAPIASSTYVDWSWTNGYSERSRPLYVLGDRGQTIIYKHLPCETNLV